MHEPTDELLITVGSHAFFVSAIMMTQKAKAEDGNRDFGCESNESLSTR